MKQIAALWVIGSWVCEWLAVCLVLSKQEIKWTWLIISNCKVDVCILQYRSSYCTSVKRFLSSFEKYFKRGKEQSRGSKSAEKHQQWANQKWGNLLNTEDLANDTSIFLWMKEAMCHSVLALRITDLLKTENNECIHRLLIETDTYVMLDVGYQSSCVYVPCAVWVVWSTKGPWETPLATIHSCPPAVGTLTQEQSPDPKSQLAGGPQGPSLTEMSSNLILGAECDPWTAWNTTWWVTCSVY